MIDPQLVDIALSLALGISLSAACGFRVFVPFLLMAIAGHTGYLTLSPDWQWIAGYPALALFATATVLEVSAYFIPWLDNILDTIATPAAAVAGTLAVVAVLADFSPQVTWTIAAITGGGIATTIQVSSVLVRGASTASSWGATNFIVAGAELIAAFVTATLAIIAPVAAVGLVVLVLFLLLRRYFL